MNHTHSVFMLSPLDGRYQSKVEKLTEFFSEFGFIKYRVYVEIKYVEYLSEHVLHRNFTKTQQQQLSGLVTDFNEAEAARVKDIEKTTKHDVKAVEYYLREKLSHWPEFHSFIHFGLTSEDINNCAYALMLQASLQQIIIPELTQLVSRLADLADQYKHLPMLARTHGQPAVPTTIGKELFVFVWRLDHQLIQLSRIPFEAKLNGAVGNYNALLAAYPEVDWLTFTSDFLKSLRLAPNLFTTQILPGDNLVTIFQCLYHVNSILQGFVQDMWRYISDGYFIQKMNPAEVGSSTMPHKINPIDFENCEGNLGLANALLGHFIDKLNISRLQRDLSDSTVKRNMGVALGHSLLAYSSCITGLNKVFFDEEKAKKDLEAHWEVVTEGIQTILKTGGDSHAYEKLKTLSRGKRLTQKNVARYIDSLDVPLHLKQQLHQLSPASYIGLAVKLVTLGMKTINTKGR